MSSDVIERVLTEVDALREEVVECAGELVRIPTINPPGEYYADCAMAIGKHLGRCGFELEYVEAVGRPEHTRTHPRINVIGTRRGRSERPVLHLNGHFDVVPAGDGWSLDPFGGIVRDGKLYGRGSCDMKAGLAAAIYAAEAVRRAGANLEGTLEISGTVDEESGGLAGVAHLTSSGRISKARTDYVIIPEPLNVDRICVGHRGVYWFSVTTEGRIAHGSMPFLGVSAIDHMSRLLESIDKDLLPKLASRTTSVPVVPPQARHATLNINGIRGGQPVDGIQTPCVADRCTAVFDRRFLLEEGFDAARAEVIALVDDVASKVPGFRYRIEDLLIVHPVRTPDDSPVIRTVNDAINKVLGREATIVASPGTYDHKHMTRIGGIPHCIAYGPGILELAHQPDEWCGVDDLVNSTKVMALSILDLIGVPRPA
jgi:succinyl-diaminopimelate desuccinylase